MFSTRQCANRVITAIVINDSRECYLIQEVHQLREQGFAGVYGESSGNTFPKDRLKPLLRSSRHYKYLAKRKPNYVAT